MNVLSLGAGVQSTTVLLMSLEGELPRLDAAVFADTGWEPTAVYAHLWDLAGLCAAAGVPLYVVSRGDIRRDHLTQTRTTIPFFVDGDGAREGRLRRACTADYKVVPIERLIRRIRGGRPVDQWFGISLDEVHRMKDSAVPWKRHVYPLVDLRMTRWDCELWLTAHGYSAPRSACIGCPFHSDAEWRHIKADPALWADAVAFDHAIRTHPAVRGTPYLHRTLTPLAEVDLSTPEDRGQQAFDLCEGFCGV